MYFNPSIVVEQRHYDIGIDLQSPCSVPPIETTGMMLPDEEYVTLLRHLNLRQREFFSNIVHWIKCKDEPIYAFLTDGAGVGKSVVIRALYQSKKISNDQELIQSDPTSCPQNQKGNN